jgi:hypothetical protein
MNAAFDNMSLTSQLKHFAWVVNGGYFNFRKDFYEIGNGTSFFFACTALIVLAGIGKRWYCSSKSYVSRHTTARKCSQRYMDTIWRMELDDW